jgi:hypothetical protein
VGDPGIQHYYTLKAVDGVGNRSEGSNQVGEFDRELTGVKQSGFLPSRPTPVEVGSRQ